MRLCMPQITFWNVQQLMDVKRELMPALRRNKAKSATRDAYSAFGAGENPKAARTIQVLLSYLRYATHRWFRRGLH